MKQPIVSHLCCTPDRIVAVIGGRIFWRPLNTDWLSGEWVPLAMPGEGAATRRSYGSEAAQRPVSKPRVRRSKG